MADKDILTRKQRKYFFDQHNFDENYVDPKTLEPPPPPPPPTFSEDEVAQVKKDGYAQGKRDGLAEAAASREKLVSSLLEKVAAAASALFLAEDQRISRYEAEAVAVTRAIFARLFPDLNKRYGLEELESIILRVMGEHRAQPEIRVDVHPDYRDDVERHIGQALAATHATGRFIVTGHADLGPGDCRMNWHNGGAARDASRLSEQIAQLLDECLADRPLLQDNGGNATDRPDDAEQSGEI